MSCQKMNFAGCNSATLSILSESLQAPTCWRSHDTPNPHSGGAKAPEHLGQAQVSIVATDLAAMSRIGKGPALREVTKVAGLSQSIQLCIQCWMRMFVQLGAEM